MTSDGGAAVVDPREIAQLALDLHAQPTAQRTVALIATSVRDVLGASEASIVLVHARDRVETAAATSDQVGRAHALEIELDEGPCRELARGGREGLIVADLAADDRWPRWAAAVLDSGLRSVVCVPLETATRRHGALTVYAPTPDAFDAEDLAIATIFARHASVALAAAQESDGLHRAMDGRKVIGIAMGRLMERHGIDADRAFEVLRRYSQAHNIKLRVVAHAVAEGGQLPGGSSSGNLEASRARSIP